MCVCILVSQDVPLAVEDTVSILVFSQVYTGFQTMINRELRRGSTWTGHMCMCTLVSRDPYLQSQELSQHWEIIQCSSVNPRIQHHNLETEVVERNPKSSEMCTLVSTGNPRR